MSVSYRPTQREFASFTHQLKIRSYEIDTSFYLISLEQPSIQDCDAEILICSEIKENSEAGLVSRVYHFIVLLKENFEIKNRCPHKKVVEYIHDCVQDLVLTIKERDLSLSMSSPGGGHFPI